MVKTSVIIFFFAIFEPITLVPMNPTDLETYEYFMRINMANIQEHIVPGTKWCGPGDIAKTFDDLGVASETDRCCRLHDHCPDFIGVGQTKYGLTNNGSLQQVFRFPCKCDEQFSKCLGDVNSYLSIVIETIYFDNLVTKCYMKAHPIVKCLKMLWKLFIGKWCAEYVFDKSKPVEWQWFNSINRGKY